MIVRNDKEHSLVFMVHAVPRASRSEIVGEHNGALRVRLAAPPVDGAANEELVRILAKTLSVSLKDVEIIAGHSSKIKQVRIGNCSRSSFERLLGTKKLSPRRVKNRSKSVGHSSRN